MATATTPPRPFNRADADRRVRHPLQALRGYIRRYVALEGLATAILFLALWFWIGVGLDYGVFALFRFDWIKELDRTAGEASSFWLRAFLLFGLVAGLLAVVALKVFRRLFREFHDRALALILERRFPRELGDRLITAVEMADPKLSEKYGFSQIMLDRTIREAAERVEKLPVHEVFNWGRLYRQLGIAVAVSVGMYFLVGIASCAVAGATGGSASPLSFFWEFNHVAGTWVQRNIFLQEHRYWLGNEYLELVRFPEVKKGPDDPGSMRVARDEYRPDVYVRAVKWVVADRGPDAPEGWRGLRWSDLPNLLEASLLSVNLPADWSGWVIDMDDLDSAVPAGVIPADWGWQNKKAGAIRQELQKPRVKAALAADRAAKVGTAAAVERLLDWHTWTVDKLELQHRRVDVREALRASGHGATDKAFETLFTALAELADSPRMRGTLRQLKIPEHVTVYRRGKTTKSSGPLAKQENNKYSFNLNDLKESVDFTVSGDEYSTPHKRITLVPPPSVARLTIDKEEPAYIHYRLLGDDAGKLKGQRQVFRDVPVSTTGGKSVILIPLGSSLTVTAVADRELREGVRVAAPVKRDEAGSLTPAANAELRPDRKTFSVGFKNVFRVIEFNFEFRDTDNVKGRRHIVIKPVDDKAPGLVGVGLAVVLRPDYDPESGKAPVGRSGERLLITPNARLPFKGLVQDDHGLARVDWKFKYVEVSKQKLGEASEEGKSAPAVVLQGNPVTRRAALVVNTLQYAPGMTGHEWFLPAYLGGIGYLTSDEARRRLEPVEGTVEMEFAQRRLAQRGPDDVTFEEMLRLLQIQPRNRGLAVELLDLKGEKEQKAFVARLREINQYEPLVSEMLHFLEVPAAERDALLKQVGTEPLRVLRRVTELSGKDKEEKDRVVTLLSKKPAQALLKEHSLAPEGFDVKDYLPKLRASSGELQRHYELHLYVSATDNNVETGPTTAPPRGPFVFLIVSENELLAEIVKQEQKLYELLREKVDELDRRRGSLGDEVLKLGSPQPQWKVIAARADQARTALRDAGDMARAVLEKYNLILTEMRVNRIEGDKVKKIETRIVNPLTDLCERSGGLINVTEQITKSFLSGLEEDIVKLRKVDKQVLDELEGRRQLHEDAGKQAGRQIGTLVAQLRTIMEAMQDIEGDSKLIKDLVAILEGRVENHQQLQFRHDDVIRRLIEDLGIDDNPKGKKK